MPSKSAVNGKIAPETPLRLASQAVVSFMNDGIVEPLKCARLLRTEVEPQPESLLRVFQGCARARGYAWREAEFTTVTLFARTLMAVR